MPRSGVAMAVVAAMAALTAFATGSIEARGSPSPPLRGGTYRVGWERGLSSPFDWSDGLDPTGEQADYGILSNLLVRTLVGYDHVAGPAGMRLVPDLATGVPAATNEGRTYVFHLKAGIRFGPPVNRVITSADFRYAIERLARKANDAPVGAMYGSPRFIGVPYPMYFDVIRGFAAYRAGQARSIAGIRTPDPRTIAFDLVRPRGDFPARLAMPAAGPVPQDVARCFEGQPGRYGADLVSSGPYMIDGADAVARGPCSRIRPMRGFGQTQLTLVRNPSYDPASDSLAARENSPDRFVFLVDMSTQRGNAVAIARRLAAGDLDDAYLRSTKLLRGAADAARRRDGLRVNAANWLFYIAMNVTQPPFDDVHVRRAMNWVIDRAALRQAAFGDPESAAIAHHVVPDALLANRLRSFAPFGTRDDHGDVARARAEMGESRYAVRRGVCVDRACKRVHLDCCAQLDFATVYSPATRMDPIIRADAAKIGITLIHGGARGERPDIPANNQPLTASLYWYPRYPDPAGFFDPLLAQRGILPAESLNLALIGLTVARARALGLGGRLRGVPTIEPDLVRCGAAAGAVRTSCYASLDRKLMTDIVPWIPLVWRARISILGPQVAKWTFDQSTGMTGFAHVALRH